ncbi:alpha/beta fold hydrolase [Streptomyces sulphureus]|uniref:alpha/beta fold hydrolase n=2 Tax=Streptomyces TaxID=1883 RepID=UPI0003742524
MNAEEDGTLDGSAVRSSAPYDIARLHLEESGDEGPLLLCLHGIGSSSASFAPQSEAFGDRMRVVAWDAPGYARSADPQVPLDLDGFADTAAALIASRAASAHVLGVSWGGVVAQRLALRHPELVDGLVVADSSVGSGAEPAQTEGMRQRVAQLEELGPRAFAEQRAPRLLSDGAPAELVQHVVDTMAESVRLPGYAYAAESMAATDLSGEIGALTVPVLVLCGSEDRVTGPGASQRIAGSVHKSAYVVVNGAGHLANQERPGAFNDWVLSHLRIAALIPEFSGMPKPGTGP